MTGIYEILNTANQKRYIGSAVNFSKRWGQHRRQLRVGAHHSPPLQRAWNKYGEAAFKFLPILTCAKSMLIFYEQQLLDKVKPEYNICKTAGSTLGVACAPEARAKLSLALMGNTCALGFKHTLETRAEMSTARVGRTLSVEHRAKIAAALTGTPKSTSHCENMSLARKGVPGNPHSAETRAKMSAAAKARHARGEA